MTEEATGRVSAEGSITVFVYPFQERPQDFVLVAKVKGLTNLSEVMSLMNIFPSTVLNYNTFRKLDQDPRVIRTMDWCL